MSKERVTGYCDRCGSPLGNERMTSCGSMHMGRYTVSLSGTWRSVECMAADLSARRVALETK